MEVAGSNRYGFAEDEVAGTRVFNNRVGRVTARGDEGVIDEGQKLGQRRFVEVWHLGAPIISRLKTFSLVLRVKVSCGQRGPRL